MTNDMKYSFDIKYSLGAMADLSELKEHMSESCYNMVLTCNDSIARLVHYGLIPESQRKKSYDKLAKLIQTFIDNGE